MSYRTFDRMPFGKHRDKPIADVPLSYLEWLLTQKWFLDDFSALSRTVKVFVDSRRNHASHETSITTDIIKVWHRKLVLRWHPDRDGGSHQAMVAINDAHSLLKELVGGRA